MRTLAICCIVVLAVSSCRKDEGEVSSFDDALDSLLALSSNGTGKDYYILPESNDFDNIPQDPNNPLTPFKVSLGRLLYHETKLGVHAKYPEGKYTYSCATCHHAQAGFQAGVRQSIADGGIGYGWAGELRTINPSYHLDSIDIQPIRTPSAMNVAYQDVVLWNGQFGATGTNAGTEANWTVGTPKEVNNLGYQGLETQAIAALSVHRMDIDTGFVKNCDYKGMFDNAFPEFAVSERYTKVTAGLAIAAYERTLLANRSPFQYWLKGDKDALTDNQKEGAIIFFGRGGCVQCHNGPALNSMEFYALGMKDFNSGEVYGGGADDATRRGRGGFTGEAADDYKFKVPQLYALRRSKFYGHGGSFTSLMEMLEYKNKAQKENANVPDSQLADEFIPLYLDEDELYKLWDFIANALDDPDLMRYVPSYLPSGFCFPNNDIQSKYDLGCE